MRSLLAFLVLFLSYSLAAPICTNSGTVTLPDAPASQIDNVLYVNIAGHYHADMVNGYNVLCQQVNTHPGSTCTMFLLSEGGPALNLTNTPTQIWVADLSANVRVATPWVHRDLSPNHQDAYTKIANWWIANGRNNIIEDARYISGLWSAYGRPHRPESKLIWNYYENLRKRGSGLVLLTDHSEIRVNPDGSHTVVTGDGFEIGINEINLKIGINPVIGLFYAAPFTLKVDTGSELMSSPFFAPHTEQPVGSGNWYIWDDSTTGFAPSNLQPNGLIMYPAGWHSDQNGGILQPGISTTIRGTVGFLVELTSPLCDESFIIGTTVNFAGHVGTGVDTTGVGPYNYVWSSDIAGTLNGGSSSDGIFVFTTSGLALGDHVVTLKVTDSQGLVAEAKVTIHIIPIPCVEDGTYHTQSEGDWGDLCSEGFASGCYRDDNFETCFPDGLDVGCKAPGYSLHFDTSSDIANYLPQLGKPAPLDHDYVNPSNPPPISTSSGNFGGQVTALALSLGFEECDPDFHSDCGKLEDLYICDNRCSQCKRNNNCKKNNNGCKYLRGEDEDEFEIEETGLLSRNKNNNNNNNGKPKYANCEAFFNWQVKDIFKAASEVLGGCSSCGLTKRSLLDTRNNNNCVRNNNCRRSAEARNNKHCSRNSNCKKNNNCCCCEDQGIPPECDPAILNACVTLINQAFIFEKTLDDVQSGRLFKEKSCDCENGYEWTATVNGQEYPLNPFTVASDITTYYGYNIGDASSANTPDGLEDSNHNKALVEFLIDGNGNQYLLVIYDTPNDLEGGSAISTVTHNGNLGSASFVVQDEPGEGLTISPGLFKTNHVWNPCCTDGYALGPIPSFSCFTFELGATSNIEKLRLASKSASGGVAVELNKADTQNIKVDICNRCKRS